MAGAERDRSVFINCPFDPEYKLLFDAIQFAVAACGFKARSALEANDAGEVRLHKIVRLIGGARLSIHDISRIELDRINGLPRFNMPIELGIALCAKHLRSDATRDHAFLVLDSERYRYQRFASDLAGVDIAAHGGEVQRVIAAVRDFLAPHAPASLPGATAARQRAKELTYVDRLLHLRWFLEKSP